ncbi:MAG: helix-turn-helix transcriptional regulator [Gammaproteobacteria bacterium]|nr:helix-turn-helix transcriptional regulator [Gammaproteobacteria bacterium]
MTILHPHSSLSERLRFAMNAATPKINAAELARAAGVKPPSVSDWLSGRTKKIDADHLISICKCLKVRGEWLIKGIGPIRPYSPKGELEWEGISIASAIAEELVPIPYIQLGNGSYSPVSDELVWLPKAELHKCGVNIESARIVRATEHDMYPDFCDGEIVSIDISANKIFDGEIYAIEHNGKIKIRVLYVNDGGLKLVAKSTDKIMFPDEFLSLQDSHSETISVIGQVWWQAMSRAVRR